MLLQTGNIQCDHKIAGVWEIKGIISHNLLNLFFASIEFVTFCYRAKNFGYYTTISLFCQVYATFGTEFEKSTVDYLSFYLQKMENILQK